MDNIQIVLINLNSDTERLSRIAERLRRMGLDYVRMSAVEGKSLEITGRIFNEAAFRRNMGKFTNKNEIACYLSHYEALKLFLQSGKKYGLILEDDMVFNSDFRKILESVLSLDFRWDFIKFNAASDKGLGNVKVCGLFGKYKLVASLFSKKKSGAYIVNRKAAGNLVEKLLPMTVPFDHEMVKFYKYGIRQYSVFPSPSEEEKKGSSIGGYGKKKSKLPFYKRASVFFYRYFYIVPLRLLYFRKLLGR
ncbi:MAG: glycosyltransferase family 25 protein [Opitutales bacterium]|nr:glycosyltransferase family 25 protein [Opitutales bacterium]